MKDLTYLFSAFAIIWAGVGLYLVRLAALRSDLQRRVARLEERAAERNRVDG
ncbi:MAG: CcmD family protein [bacterium]|nr:CcmD family protein [bacterium]MDT8396140.1 CcmD family protein [bacterium]